ncbi:hypothetical protein [Trinickia terrae]|uniref:hypothetical protein n=1 Tax=Trinickia terrae TaxID=2571161 RepID=UPI00146A6F42|nr:hypothetical protein [Trinickia terrae]
MRQIVTTRRAGDVLAKLRGFVSIFALDDRRPSDSGQSPVDNQFAPATRPGRERA